MVAPALQWIRLFDGPAHGWDNAQDLLVVGSQESAVDNVDPVVRKLGPDGALAWERSFDGPVGGTDFAVLPGGDLLVVSTTEGSAVLQWWSSGGEPGASALYAHPGAGHCSAPVVGRHPWAALRPGVTRRR